MHYALERVRGGGSGGMSYRVGAAVLRLRVFPMFFEEPTIKLSVF